MFYLIITVGLIFGVKIVTAKIRVFRAHLRSDHEIYRLENWYSAVSPDPSDVIAQESAVISQKYQNQKAHDQGCPEHPKFRESTQ